VSRRAGLAAAAAVLLVWVGTAGLPPAVRLWTAALLGALPPLMILQARELVSLQPLPRQAAYVSSILSLWLLAGATAGVAAIGNIDASSLGLSSLPLGPFVLWSAGLTAAGLAIVAVFHLAGFRESDVTRQLIPESPTEKALFVGVSLTAGVCEEYIFRGFLIYALHAASGSAAVAVVVSSAAFGLVHAYQQPAGAIRAGILGALLALSLVAAGSIWPAVIAHAALDLLAGLLLARWLTR
jgi:uncharacterized protein